MAFRDFLYYSKSDRRSIVFLSLIAVILVGVLILKGPEHDEPVAVETGADSTVQSAPIVMREFDPNTVDSVSLIGFGLSPKQTHTFLNYRRAGAVFRTPEAIDRVYALTDEDVSRLLPYVRIGADYSRKETPKHTYERKPAKVSAAADTVRTNRAEWKRSFPEKFKRLTKVDPNTADTALLQRIPGVGSWISRNIVEQRKRLGGYHSVEQLLEVKYFSPELLEWFEVDTTAMRIEAFDINTALFQQLNSHPYISYEQTRDLLRYIRLYGKLADIDALRRTGIFTEEEVDKLAPYVQFGH